MSGGRSGARMPLPSFRQIPALHAVLIQTLSFVLTHLAASGMSVVDVQLTVFDAALLQGATAASITRLRRLAFWWLPIQAIFPIAVIAALSFHLPSIIYFALFAGLLGLYWSTYRTQVPFYPSSPATWNAVLAELPTDRSVRVVDIGSGLGGLVLHLADARPESLFTGIEVAPLPWLVSVLRRRFRQSAAQFVRGDYGRLNFATQDVVFAYLSPAAMPSLWRKARKEMRPGTLLLSLEFGIPDVESHFVRMPRQGGPALYGWRM